MLLSRSVSCSCTFLTNSLNSDTSFAADGITLARKLKARYMPSAFSEIHLVISFFNLFKIPALLSEMNHSVGTISTILSVSPISLRNVSASTS